MASQHVAILCHRCKGNHSPPHQRGDLCPIVFARHTLGNAGFVLTATPIEASNGVVVVLDGVLLPAWLPPANASIRPASPADNEPIVFRAVNTNCDPTLAQRCCGQVDAASSVPPALLADEGKLKEYITKTLSQFTMPDRAPLELGTCAEAGFTTLDPYVGGGVNGNPVYVDWDSDGGFAGYCAFGEKDTIYGQGNGCGCVIGLCPAIPPPDKPICAICNGVLNRPRQITFYLRNNSGATPPPPPPLPDIFGSVLDVLRKTPELSTLYNVVQGNAAKDSTGRPYRRECPRGAQSADCSIPSEEPDGRQTFTGTIEEKGPWTFFAPDNAAFAKAPALTAALRAGWQDGQNELFLDNNFDTLYYHLLPGNFSAAQLPNGKSNTLLGADLTTSHLGKGFTFVTGGNTTNVARVQKSIQVTNGVVHIISAVLIPPVDTRRSKQQGYFTCCAAGVAGSCCDACCKAGNIQCC